MRAFVSFPNAHITGIIPEPIKITQGEFSIIMMINDFAVASLSVINAAGASFENWLYALSSIFER